MLQERVEKVLVSPEQAAIFARITWRIIPFLFLLYVVAYVDRINVGFAALSMNSDLGLTSAAFGFATTMFYVGYVLCEIPSNLLMAKNGARVWLSRIMITWGLAASATMFVVGPYSLYGIRFLVGVFEAGFVPGALLYLTYWFPGAHRARSNGLLMMAQPMAVAIGAVISGYILVAMDGVLGLNGWRWMFLLEGLPATLLGVLALFYLRDGPSTVKWLSDHEKAAVALALSSKASSAVAPTSVRSELLNVRVAVLAVIYFCLTNTLNATSTWMPTIVREIASTYSLVSVGFLSAIPPIGALLTMPLWVISSDRSQERYWHTAAAFCLAAIGWLTALVFPHAELRLVGLVLTTCGAFCAMSTFWTIPQTLFSPAARPAGLALVSSFGLLGSAVSPVTIGWLRDLTGNFSAGFIYAAVLLFVAAGLTLALNRVERRSVRNPADDDLAVSRRT
jgi:MFS transporter, ACS family, 4-hydroxyphenylacetate permease